MYVCMYVCVYIYIYTRSEYQECFLGIKAAGA